MRMFVRGLGMPVGHFAVFLGRGGVLLGLFVLAELVMMRRLMVMMRSGVVVSSRLVMVLLGRMFFRL